MPRSPYLNRLPNGSLRRLEPYAGKLARTVLRGEGRSNVADLLDCYACTASVLASKQKQYPTHYTDARMSRYQQDIKDKKMCADCIGLMKGYMWEQNGTVRYDAATDVNTTGLYNRATVKGLIQSIPEVPGLIVYKTGHVGVYEGNGKVIEAKGFAYGVIRSQITDTQWTHWIAYPDLSYAGFETLLLPNNDFPYTAVVATKTTPLNLWDSPKKGKSLGTVAKGDTLLVVGSSGTLGWVLARKAAVTGYADAQYLVRVTTGGSSSTSSGTDDNGASNGNSASNNDAALYDMTLHDVPADVMERVLALFPAAVVTDAR